MVFLLAVSSATAHAGSRVLVIWDDAATSTGTTALKAALEGAGMTVTLSATSETAYDGTNPSPSGFDVIILLDGSTYSADMPAAGQTALDTFVRTNGGGFIAGEWISYEQQSYGYYAGLSEIFLLVRSNGAEAAYTYSDVSAYASHPILQNLPSSFSITAGISPGSVKAFSSYPAYAILNVDYAGVLYPAVAVREMPRGRAVTFTFASNYGTYLDLTQANVQQLYIDSVRWAACDLDQDGYASSSCYGGTDCDDSDASAHVTSTYYRDSDGDGYGTTSTTTACSLPSGYATKSGDCNDANGAIYPSRAEVCDGIDQDCDGTPDDGLATLTYYKDGDGDGYGAGTALSGCAVPSGYASSTGDCNDANNKIYPTRAEICDGIDQDCDGTADDGLTVYTYYRDSDGDGFGTASSPTSTCQTTAPSGYTSVSTDCDDTNSAIKPGAAEVCNTKDDDCNGVVDDGVGTTWYADADGDTYGNASAPTVACSVPSGHVANADDCDDTKATIYPGAPEALNGADDDCDGEVDEGTTGTDDDLDGYTEDGGDCDDSDDTIYPGAAEFCDGFDQDCDTVVDEGTECYDDDGDGYDESQGDCDDGNADRSPGVAEILENGVDDDCDGIVDEGGINDPDEDGYSVAGGDCDNADGTVYPGAPELEDGKDNDCDEIIDEGTAVYDDDGDGFTEDDGDCDDADELINPDGSETADGVDEDCDGVVDNGTEAYDDDGDGYTEEGGDCEDADDAIHPGASEEPNGVDDNCDGTVDEGLDDVDGDGFGVGDGDCDDANEFVYPNAYEICDALDNDCNEAVDDNSVCAEGDTGCGCAVGGSGTVPLILPVLALALRRRRWG